MATVRLATNYLYLSGAECASKLVTFAAISYLAHMVGPESFGYVEFAGSVLLCAGLIVDQGFGPYGAREIARAPERTAALVSEIVAVRFVLAIIAYATVIVFALSLGRSAVLTQLLLIYGLSLLGAPLLLQWVFQGHNGMPTVAAIQMIRQMVFAGVVFAFVREASQIWIVAVAEVASVASAAAYGLWRYASRFENALWSRPAISVRLFREAVPIGLSQMFWMMRMFGATVLVGLIASPRELGFFGGAMRILVALHAFVWLYFFNLLPVLSHRWKNSREGFSTLMDRSLHAVGWLAAVGGLGWVLAAPAAVTAVYGPAFIPAGAVLQWLAGVCVVAGLSGHYRYGLIAAGRQTGEMVISAVGAALAMALIPVGYAWGGATGAAMGLLATEIAVWWIAWWWARGRLGLVGHGRILIRPAMAAVVAVGLARLLPLSSEVVRDLIALVSVAAQAYALDIEVRDRTRELMRGWHSWLCRHLDRGVREAA